MLAARGQRVTDSGRVFASVTPYGPGARRRHQPPGVTVHSSPLYQVQAPHWHVRGPIG